MELRALGLCFSTVHLFYLLPPCCAKVGGGAQEEDLIPFEAVCVPPLGPKETRGSRIEHFLDGGQKLPENKLEGLP